MKVARVYEIMKSFEKSTQHFEPSIPITAKRALITPPRPSPDINPAANEYAYTFGSYKSRREKVKDVVKEMNGA